jgi:hypothetical protein
VRPPWPGCERRRTAVAPRRCCLARTGGRVRRSGPGQPGPGRRYGGGWRKPALAVASGHSFVVAGHVL